MLGENIKEFSISTYISYKEIASLSQKLKDAIVEIIPKQCYSIFYVDERLHVGSTDSFYKHITVQGTQRQAIEEERRNRKHARAKQE